MKRQKNHLKAVLLACAGTLMFTAHFTAIAFYIAPENPISAAILPVTRNYVEPVFSQNWKLFAPNPSSSSQKTWVRCGSEQQWLAWMDPIEALQRKHNANRVTYRGKLLYVYRGVGNQLLNAYIAAAKVEKCELGEAPCMAKLHERLRENSAHEVATRYVKTVCARLGNFSRAQIRFVTVYPKQFSQRLSDKPYARMSYFDLPEFQL